MDTGIDLDTCLKSKKIVLEKEKLLVEVNAKEYLSKNQMPGEAIL